MAVNDVEHNLIPVGDIHGLVNWVFTSVAAMQAAPVTIDDVHKLAMVQEVNGEEITRSYYFLQSANPKVWGGINQLVPGANYEEGSLAVFDSATSSGVRGTNLMVDSEGRLYAVRKVITVFTGDFSVIEEMSGSIILVDSPDPVTVTYPSTLDAVEGMDVLIYQKGAGTVTLVFETPEMDATGTLETAAVSDWLHIMANSLVAMVGFGSAAGGGGGGTPSFPDLAGSLGFADKVLVQKGGVYGRVPRSATRAPYVVFSKAELVAATEANVDAGQVAKVHSTQREYTFMSGAVPVWLEAAGFDSEAVIYTAEDPAGDSNYWLQRDLLDTVYCSDFGSLTDPATSYVSVQKALDFAGLAGVPNVKMARDNQVTPYLDGQIQIEYNGVNFEQGNIIAGPNYRFRITGNVAEAGSTSLLASDTLQGTDVFQLANAADQANFPVGSQVVVRGLRDINTFYPVDGYKQTYIVIAHPGADTLQVDRPVEVDFLQDYMQPGFDTIWGDPNYTRLYPVLSTSMKDANPKIGDRTVAVTDSSLFKVGDYVQLEDQKTPSDVSVYYTSAGAKIHNEINRVIGIEGSNLQLERPIATGYLLSYNAVVIKLNPVIGSSLNDTTVIWAGRTLNKTNALEMAYCVDSHFRNCRTLGHNGFSWHRHAQRMSDCYRSSITGFEISGAAYSAGGEGYGAVTYGSTDCLIADGKVHKTRHGVLLARASSGITTDNVVSTDCFISDFDVHGNNNNASVFKNCKAIYGPTHGAAQELPALAIADGGLTWDITVDYGTAGAVTSNGTNTVRVNGSGRAIPTSGSISDTSELTLGFLGGHPFVTGDVITISGAAEGYNGDWTVTSDGTTTITATPVVPINPTLLQRVWEYSPAALVVCDAKDFDGYYSVSAINDDVITINSGGQDFPVGAVLDNVWVTVHYGYSKAAYRVGNPTHFYGDFNIKFENCVAENYDPGYFNLDALHSTTAVACDPLPGVYDVTFDVKAINCQYYTNPQRNTKFESPSIDLSPFNRDAVADFVTIYMTNADQQLSVGYWVELVGTTRPELEADAYKVLAVGPNSFSFSVPGIGSFALEAGDGTLLNVYPYLDLRIENIEYKIDMERNRVESGTDFPVKLRGLSRNWLKDIRISKFRAKNCRTFALVEDIDNFESLHFEHIWDMPEEPWAAQEAIDTPYTQLTTAYVFDIDGCPNCVIHGDFLDCARGVKLQNSPGAHISGKFQCNQARVLEDLGGNDGAVFVGKVAGPVLPVVTGEGTSDIHIIYEDYRRPYLQVSANTTLSAIHWGRDIAVTAAATLTIPAGLPDGFNCRIGRITAGVVDFNVAAVTAYGATAIANQNDWVEVNGLATDTYALMH